MSRKTKDINVKEVVESIYDYQDKLNTAMQNESDAIKAFSTDETRTIKRKDEEGKEKPVEISNKEIMEEIRISRSLTGESGQLLKEVAPDTYKALEQTSNTLTEMYKYVYENLGINLHAPTFLDYMFLMEVMFEYKVNNK